MILCNLLIYSHVPTYFKDFNTTVLIVTAQYKVEYTRMRQLHNLTLSENTHNIACVCMKDQGHKMHVKCTCVILLCKSCLLKSQFIPPEYTYIFCKKITACDILSSHISNLLSMLTYMYRLSKQVCRHLVC